jgi:bacteriocin biosynthesis cyclodehydratase domain-containing protein
MNLRIRPHFSIIAHSPDVAELRYGVWNPTSFTLRDDTCSGKLTRLLARLDGMSSIAQIASEECVSQGEVESLVEHLNELGVLESEPSNALDFLLDHLPGSRGVAGERPPDPRPLIVAGDGELSRELVTRMRETFPAIQASILEQTDPAWLAIQDAALDRCDDGLAYHKHLAAFEHWRGKFIVFAQSVVDPPLVERLNRICLGHQVPWLHAAIDGPFVFIGPLTSPYRSACYQCFETRLLMNLRESASYQRYKRAIADYTVKKSRSPAEPMLRNLLSAHTAVETVNYLLTGHACSSNKVLSIYLPTMEFAYHDVLRVPNCPACGPEPGTGRRELYFDLAAVT